MAGKYIYPSAVIRGLRQIIARERAEWAELERKAEYWYPCQVAVERQLYPDDMEMEEFEERSEPWKGRRKDRHDTNYGDAGARAHRKSSPRRKTPLNPYKCYKRKDSKGPLLKDPDKYPQAYDYEELDDNRPPGAGWRGRTARWGWTH